MAHRYQKVDPFNDSEGPSTRHEAKLHNYGPDPKQVRMRHMASERHHSGMKKYGREGDPLYSAFGEARKHVLPTDHNRYSHTSRVAPTGAHYNPAGAFGRTRPMGVGSTHQIYGGNRMSARPANAVGSPMGRRGGNAVGSPPNTHGENANPRPRVPNRPGENAVGNPPNRYGGNALAHDFKPRFGFHGGARRA